MEVKIGKLAIGFIGYKGAGYTKWDSAFYMKNSTSDKDWSGLYIAADNDTAKGYLPDAVPEDANGNGIVYIHKAEVTEEVNLITCMDESFKTGEIDMDALRSALDKNDVKVNDKELVMTKLGELGYFFKCYNNEDGAIEIIVPNSMADKITMSPFKQCELKNYEVSKCEDIK